jgi:hypothetical protein
MRNSRIIRDYLKTVFPLFHRTHNDLVRAFNHANHSDLAARRFCPDYSATTPTTLVRPPSLKPDACRLNLLRHHAVTVHRDTELVRCHVGFPQRFIQSFARRPRSLIPCDTPFSASSLSALHFRFICDRINNGRIRNESSIATRKNHDASCQQPDERR